MRWRRSFLILLVAVALIISGCAAGTGNTGPGSVTVTVVNGTENADQQPVDVKAVADTGKEMFVVEKR